MDTYQGETFSLHPQPLFPYAQQPLWDGALSWMLHYSNLETPPPMDPFLESWLGMENYVRDFLGHLQRVTEMTMHLANAVGIASDQLNDFFRGAILHDIGKIGIPKSILLKPGPLNEDEWKIMRKHPEIARDYLSRTSTLKSAIDIPYCHHEKWDGTGYPQGFKGKQIPIAARIFSIVDVWDALTSDRPYRPAWPAEKALALIIDQSGKHFEPQIVDTFIELYYANRFSYPGRMLRSRI
jgi:HD-GYP domain-containing protein (c-di-GMP phosphodiesterase class II)